TGHRGRAQVRQGTPAALAMQGRGASPDGPINMSGMTGGPDIYKLEDAYLNWRIAPSEQVYGAIDGKKLHGYVEQLAAISRRYRDQGHRQYWGRIQGTSGDAENAQWLLERFKQAGLDARLQTLDLPPQWIPESWDVTGTANGKTVKVTSAWPGSRSAK